MACSRVLETPRLRLEPFTAAHLTPRYVAWLNDPEVVRYSDQRHQRHTLDSCRAYWQAFAQTPHYFWAIVARALSPRERAGDEGPQELIKAPHPSPLPLGEGTEGGLHIGNITAYVDVRHAVADVGILIGERQVWGAGYGSEAWMAVCDYLLGEAGMRKVTAGTLEVNTAMLAVMRRAGMVEDGRRRQHCLFEGRAVDVIHAALFRAP